MNSFRTCTTSLDLGSSVRIDASIHDYDAISVLQNGCYERYRQEESE